MARQAMISHKERVPPYKEVTDVAIKHCIMLSPNSGLSTMLVTINNFTVTQSKYVFYSVLHVYVGLIQSCLHLGLASRSLLAFSFRGLSQTGYERGSITFWDARREKKLGNIKMMETRGESWNNSKRKIIDTTINFNEE